MDFVEQEASEASSSENSGEDSESEIKTKKKKKAKKRPKKIVDSSEEEDDEELDGNLEGFIDDNVVEDDDEDGEGEEGSGPEGEKRKHEDSDLEEDLEDDDYDLLEENLGVRVQRKKKLKRIRAMSDDEESGKEDDQQDDRDVIAREIFDDDEDAASMEQDEREERDKEQSEQLQVGSDSGEESEDNFIVDDDGQPIPTHKKKKKHIIHDDQALQEAQDIFGVDFDFEEFDEYGDEDSEAEEDEDEEYENEEDEDAVHMKKVSKKKKKKGRKTTIFEIFEPSDLERAHFTDHDQEIRSADMPERFQLRGRPVCPTEEGELEEEAEWIYKQAFTTPPISRQDYWDQSEGAGVGSGRFGSRKGPGTVGKIKSALNFMRNQQFEVPFIAFYRKEYVEPELNINDLWKVYQADEKWMQLRQRKTNLVRLFEKMQTYQFDSIDQDQPLESHFRALSEEDVDRVKAVETIEELNDVYHHFLLYYGNDVPKMKTYFKNKKKQDKEKQKQLNPDAPDEGEDKEDDEEEDDQDTLKQASRKSGYTMCVQAGLADLASKFGLSAEKFGENLRDNYQRYDVEQEPAGALEIAQEFIHGQFRTPAEAMKGAGHMVAMRIAHEPLVRQVVRQVFYDRAMLSCTPTKKGIKEIDENHACYTFRYLKNKPIKNFQNEQFLQLIQSVDEGCMTYDIHMDEKDQSRACVTYFEEIRQLYHRDEFSEVVEEWNDQRGAALQRALEVIIYPQMIREAKSKLVEEAKEHIIRACCRKLYNCLKVAPYQADQQLDDDEDEFDSSKGTRVMAISFSDDREMAQFGALIDGEGEVVDILRLAHLNKRKNSWRAEDREKKAEDIERLKDFISTKKPHVIAVAAFSRESMTILEDVKHVVSELEQEQQMAPISVELVDDELSTIYSTSKKAENDFREYPTVLRHAISIARRLQDPLVELAQLCNADEDIMCIKYHPMQDSIPRETLMNALYLEFVNRVNEVGVDVNRCVAHSHTAPLVQFVCGLGPRKGYQLLKILKQNNSRLENRTQLVVMCHMGPKVFINCAGFIKIDTSALGDSTEAYVEVLDGSRVHPETYEWARKMAVDALEYDDTAEDANPAGALEEILENPERLKDLDLDAFADELERQGYGNKHITLYDIRAELNHRYKDLRVPFRSPTSEERFNMITKETPNTFYIGKSVLCRVATIAHRRPKGDQLDQANPVRNDETGLWQCPFCQKNDFPELSEVWNHFDGGECVGQPIGVKCRLDNGIMGFIHVKNISDKEVKNPEDRVKIGMPIHARITKIDIDRFAVDLTSRTSDLVDKEGKWKPTKDTFYDFDLEEKEQKKEADKKKQQALQTYVKRVIVHPQFQNVDYKSCVRLMANMEPGDVIIRPSSKGSDHLTCTWKVAGDILQHIDIREEGKENAFSLGRSLWIDDEEFEDLDEIIARHIQPMSQFARDLLNHKYYKDSQGGKREIMDKILFEEKKKAPSKIPYYYSVSQQCPGKFMLSYLPRKTPRHEFVTVTPEGVRYRGQMFHSINACIRWFKEHFKDPIPGATPTNLRTPHGGSTVGQTPSVRGMDSVTLQRAAAGLPNSVFNTLAQVAGQTPRMGVGLQNPLQTPLMTPVMTPSLHPLATPSTQHYVTPGQQAYATPSSLATPSLQQTPQYQHPPHTPRGGASTQPWGARTPQVASTPVDNGFVSRTPQSSVSSKKAPRHESPSSTEWAKMAEMWAKRKEVSSGSKRRTPRSSPYGGSTPGTPRGDATPLFDEL